MSERAQPSETGSRVRDLAEAVGFVAVAGFAAGSAVEMIDYSPETGTVFGGPALLLAVAAAAVAISAWNRLTNKQKPS